VRVPSGTLKSRFNPYLCETSVVLAVFTARWGFKWQGEEFGKSYCEIGRPSYTPTMRGKVAGRGLREVKISEEIQQ